MAKQDLSYDLKGSQMSPIICIHLVSHPTTHFLHITWWHSLRVKNTLLFYDHKEGVGQKGEAKAPSARW